MINSIPLYLLIHSAKYIEVKNGTFGETNTTTFDLKNIRIQPSTSSIMVSENIKEKRGNLIMYFDTEHSIPQDIVFKLGNIVEWNDQTLRISKISPLYAFDPLKPHHYEIELI